MARLSESADLLKCSFCGKSQKQVKKLIAGPGVYICDECIDLCNEIIEEELAETAGASLKDLPKPVAAAMRSHPRAIFVSGTKVTNGNQVEYRLTLKGTRKTAMVVRPDGTVVSFK